MIKIFVWVKKIPSRMKTTNQQNIKSCLIGCKYREFTTKSTIHFEEYIARKDIKTSGQIALTSAQFQQSHYYLNKASTKHPSQVSSITQLQVVRLWLWQFPKNTLGLPDMVQQIAPILKRTLSWEKKWNWFSAERIKWATASSLITSLTVGKFYVLCGMCI